VLRKFLGALQGLPNVGEFLMDVKPEEVRALWKAMCRSYGTRTVTRSDSYAMRELGTLLGAMGIIDRGAWLDSCATTFGYNIYLPFDVGVPQAGWDLWAQAVTCAHEHQHVVQFQRAGAVGYVWDYVTDAARRAEYEVEALTCNLELDWWHWRNTPTPAYLANLLTLYACGPVEVQAARRRLDMVTVTVRAGGIITAAGRTALDWLDANCPHLAAARAG